MEDVTAILISLKEQALEAYKNHDFQFYEHYLADSAIAIAPSGIYNKAAIIKQMDDTGSSHFRSTGLCDTKIIVLTAESGIVTYKARYENLLTKDHMELFVTTVYAKTANKWEGIFYQQTIVNS